MKINKINFIKNISFFFLLFLLITCRNHQNNNNSLQEQFSPEMKQQITQVSEICNTMIKKYNFLFDVNEKYQNQMHDCQNLLIKIDQIANDWHQKCSQRKMKINEYDHLLWKSCDLIKEMVQDKKQWITNNHLGYGYWIFGIMQMFFTSIIFVWYLNLNNDNKPKWFNENTKIIGSGYKFLFDTLTIKGKINNQNNDEGQEIKGYFIPFVCFSLMFIFNSLTFFDDYLINTIHHLFIKDRTRYFLPKNDAEYFYYCRDSRYIVYENKSEEIFVVPTLFNNNHCFMMNIFDFMVNLLNLIVINWTIIKCCFDKIENNLFLCRLTRFTIFTFVFVKLFLLINIILIHFFSERNYLNLINLEIINFFKSLPIINKYYYYVSKRNYDFYYVAKQFSSLLANLMPIIFITLLLLISWLSDFLFCQVRGIKYMFNIFNFSKLEIKKIVIDKPNIKENSDH